MGHRLHTFCVKHALDIEVVLYTHRYTVERRSFTIFGVSVDRWKAIYDRLVSITLQPRPTVRLGDYYVPEPRRLAGEGVEDVDQSPSLVP